MKPYEPSSQYRWQQKQKKLGNCIKCGKKRNKSKQFCDKHLKDDNKKRLLKYYKNKKII
jgi:hypothetical protein